MRDDLAFVRGVVNEKHVLTVLQHFFIHDGRIQGTDGRVAIDSPCVAFKGVNAVVPAGRFCRAVDSCAREPRFTFTEQRLTISSGSFRAHLPLAELESYPVSDPPKQKQPLRIDLKRVLSLLRPFVSSDGTRPWSCGILLDGKHAHATNNVALARAPCEIKLTRPINLPVFAVDEILRVPDLPTHLHAEENSATLFYDKDRWIRSQLFSSEWPDLTVLYKSIPKKMPKVPEGLSVAVDHVAPFCPDENLPVIVLGAKGIGTEEGVMGAFVSLPGLAEGRYRAEVFQLVLSAATHIDLKGYPGHVFFAGQDGLVGVFTGVR